MEYRLLGTAGLKVSALGLGTWAMGGAVESWGVVDDRESIATIHQAFDLGITFIDTAPIYGLGHSEEIVGIAIQGRRDRVVLASKCGLTFPRRRDELPQRCLSRAHIFQECERSLKRLRTDWIDLYQCHWPDPGTPIRETMDALYALKERGWIRAIGLSNFSCEEIAAAREFGSIDSLQPPFSMLQMRSAEDLIPYCQEHGIGVLPYSPLSKGLLTGKFAAGDKYQGIRARDPDFVGKRYHRNLSLVESLRPIADQYGISIMQLVLNWTAGFPGVTAPIVGAKRPSQVAEQVGALGWQLAAADRANIDGMLKNFHGA